MSMASPPVARLGGALDAVAVSGGAAQVGKRVGQTVGRGCSGCSGCSASCSPLGSFDDYMH
jgi:hypothetical protein